MSEGQTSLSYHFLARRLCRKETKEKLDASNFVYTTKKHEFSNTRDLYRVMYAFSNVVIFEYNVT
jgi:hypothetical protein